MSTKTEDRTWRNVVFNADGSARAEIWQNGAWVKVLSADRITWYYEQPDLNFSHEEDNKQTTILHE